MDIFPPPVEHWAVAQHCWCPDCRDLLRPGLACLEGWGGVGRGGLAVAPVKLVCFEHTTHFVGT